MESINCDLCGSWESEVIARQSDKLHGMSGELFTLVKCSSCGLHFTNPRPTISEIGDYYSPNYAFHENNSAFHKLTNRILDGIANCRWTFLFAAFPFLKEPIFKRIRPKINDPILSFIKQRKNVSFLDIGCGSGVNAHFWGAKSSLQTCNQFANVAGVEVSPVARAVLTKAGIKCWADIEFIPDNQKFDLIRMNWSLEHVHSPSAYLSFCAEHLTEGGQVVIAVPNYEGLLYRLAPECVELPVHLYHFTPSDIYRYSKKANLKVLDIKTFSYPEMFYTSAEVGLLSSSFKSRPSILGARGIIEFLKSVDDFGWGNDMLVILERSPIVV